MKLHFALLLLMTILGAAASLFLKKASAFVGIWNLIKNVNLYIGAGMYLITAILNIILLNYLDYSVVLPLTSITYIWTMIFSYFILKERINKNKMIGVLFILIGAIFVSI